MSGEGEGEGALEAEVLRLEIYLVIHPDGSACRGARRRLHANGEAAIFHRDGPGRQIREGLFGVIVLSGGGAALPYRRVAPRAVASPQQLDLGRHQRESANV